MRAIGLRGEVASAQVGGEHAVVAAEVGQLVAERVPALREPVQEHDQRSVAGVCVVQANIAEVGVLVLDVSVGGWRS